MCQDEQVNEIAGRYYPDGPVFSCHNGYLHFTDQMQWNQAIVQNTAVVCSNLLEDIDLQDDQGTCNFIYCYAMVVMEYEIILSVLRSCDFFCHVDWDYVISSCQGRSTWPGQSGHDRTLLLKR